MFFALSWGIGYVLVCNSVIVKYTKKKPKMFLRIPYGHVVVVGAIAAFLIELLCNWLWKLWYYPPFTPYLYLTLIVFILIGYFYFLLKGYMAIRAFLIARGFSRKRIKINKSYKTLFNVFGIVGVLFLFLATLQLIGTVHWDGISFFNSFGLRHFSLINVGLMTISLILILEYLEYKEREDTFLMHLMQGDWTPFISIVVAALFTGITMEGFNIPLSIWVYTNWPDSHVAISHLPLTVFLAWPIQYIFLISIYRLLYKRETAKIWY